MGLKKKQGGEWHFFVVVIGDHGICHWLWLQEIKLFRVRPIGRVRYDFCMNNLFKIAVCSYQVGRPQLWGLYPSNYTCLWLLIGAESQSLKKGAQDILNSFTS